MSTISVNSEGECSATVAVNHRPSAVARCNAFYVLARAFDLPRTMDDACPSLLRASFLALHESLHAAAERTAEAWQHALTLREALSVAHARLFLGPFEILAPPYASLYLSPDRRLMGKVSLEAARHYSEAGLKPNSSPREAPDHVTLELEFMYFLAFRELIDDEPVWTERQRRFWCSHLGQWLPDLARNMAAADCHPFYDELASLLVSFGATETARFELNALVRCPHGAL